MAEAKEREAKKPIAVASKAGWWVAGMFLIVVVVLVASGFRKVNPFLLLFLMAVGGGILIYYLRKPKQLDYAKVVKLIQKSYLNEFGYGLDYRQFQVISAASMIYVFFPYEAKTFGYDTINKIIKEVETNHIYTILRDRNKSRLFDLAQRHLSAEAKLKGIAEALNVDIGIE